MSENEWVRGHLRALKITIQGQPYSRTLILLFLKALTGNRVCFNNQIWVYKFESYTGLHI